MSGEKKIKKNTMCIWMVVYHLHMVDLYLHLFFLLYNKQQEFCVCVRVILSKKIILTRIDFDYNEHETFVTNSYFFSASFSSFHIIMWTIICGNVFFSSFNSFFSLQSYTTNTGKMFIELNGHLTRKKNCQ